MSAAATQFDETIRSLTAVVDAGAPAVGCSAQAVELLDAVELARRLAAVAAVDALERIDDSRAFYDHGHASARVMFEHVAGVSGSEAHRLDKIRRMIGDCEQIASTWRAGSLSVDKAALLGWAFANPRTRERFVLDQRWFIKKANRFGFRRFKKVIARWLEIHDDDGPEPGADPSHERRNATLVQDHFSKAWKLDASLGSLAGSAFNQTLEAYVAAEFAVDWAHAEKTHGTDTCEDLLARTNAQRRADALVQIAADAVNSDKPSAAVKRVHNIIWNGDTYEEVLRRWAGGAARLLDPDTYNITDTNGHPIAAGPAFADSLVSSLRRVIQDAASVTLDLSKPTRLFTGLARHGVILATTECYWPGCHVPTSQCHIDHLRPAARSGSTTQRNGLPACPRHNRVKERGYTVTRQPNGNITITTPNGDTIESHC